MQRINIGCGSTPTPGWLNIDNSLTVRLSNRRLVLRALTILGVAGRAQLEFARSVAENKTRVIWGNAVRRIPVPDQSVSVIYTSHMLEHLDRTEARRFLAEAHRVLAGGGILRIAVPDLRKHARRYVEETKDADAFVASTLLAVEKPRGVIERLRYVFVGPRHHHWMYDADSLIRLVASAGFRDAIEIPAGSTTIPDPGDLDLYQRQEESLYIEARRS